MKQVTNTENAWRCHFIEELRQARLAAQKNAEAFDELLFVFERLGCFLTKKALTLGDYRSKLLELASKSALGSGVGSRLSKWHTEGPVLYKLVNDARNDALHQGAGARHLTEHAIELALLFEDSIMNDADNPLALLRDIMVRTPIIAHLWQPISFVRQIMLTNSFSSLPIFDGDRWKIIRDSQIVAFLRSKDVNIDRKSRLGMTIKEVMGNRSTLLQVPKVYFDPNATIIQAAEHFANHQNDTIVLVIDDEYIGEQEPKRLLGIVTAFDIL